MSITMTSWLRHVAAARFSGRREARFTLSLARNRRRPIGSVVIEKSVRPETATPLTELIRRRRNIVEGANNARPVERALASTAGRRRRRVYAGYFLCCGAATQFVKRWSRNCADVAADRCRNLRAAVNRAIIGRDTRGRARGHRGGWRSAAAIGNVRRQDNCHRTACSHVLTAYKHIMV